MTPDKALELKRSKRRALWLLLAAVAVFVTTILLPRGPWVDGVKAVAEAAMVGALADWFAVVALFRRVPIPFVSRHTEIIPKNKDKIADNLAVFVREKFLGPDALAAQIRQHDPAQKLGAWLGEPANTEALGGYVTKLMSFALDMTDDARIQSFVHDAFRAVIDRIDLSQSAGAILDTLTKDGRHQALLDDAIEQVVDVLDKEENREVIAGFIVEWLKTQYPKVEKIMPTQWFGENGARMLASAVSRVLEGVAADPEHELRQRFDRTVVRLTERLKHDPAFIEKGEEIKRYVRDGAAFNDYVRDLWDQLRAWLKADLARPDSALHRQAAMLGGWLGARLAEAGIACVAERARREGRARDGAGFRGFPDAPHPRHGAQLGRARDVAADRAEHRQGPAIHPHQRHAGRRPDRARVVSGVAGAALGGRLAALTRPQVSRGGRDGPRPRVMRALSRRAAAGRAP